MTQLELDPVETAKRIRPRRRFNTDLLYPLGLVVAVLLAWQLWVSLGDVPLYRWPPLSDVLDTLIHSGLLLTAAGETVKLIVFGFLLAVGVGILFAVLTVAIRTFELMFFPLLVAKQFVPTIAISPLFIIWWGFGTTPKLVVITLFGYFSVLITTVTGLRATQVETLHLVRAMGANTFQTFWKVRLPRALPNIFAGLRIAITSCVIGTVIAEFIVGSEGLGYLIRRAEGTGDSVTLVAGVIYLAVIGTIGFALVALAERLATPWWAGRRASLDAAAL